MSNRRALCVGVNLYKNLPNATLHGCVNDVTSMKGLCKDFLGFKDPDIVSLTDAQATKAAIMQNLKDMVAGAKAGKYSYLLFSMSSHGTQVPDVSGDETSDHADEAFCPHDLIAKGSVWDSNHIIVDDELHDLFVQIPSSVLLEVYMDTCHSGSGLKALDFVAGSKPRWLAPPSMEAFKEVEGRQSRGIAERLREKGLPNQILWAACRSDQTSADAYIGGSYHGAFTYYFEKEMRACQNKLSRKAVLAKVRADLKGPYSQVPQLECPATDKEVVISERAHKAEAAAE
jgi:metacaspase-1